MKGDKKMMAITTALALIGTLLIVVSLTLALVRYDELEMAETETQGTEAPAPGEITRIRLAEGLTIRNVDMVRPEGIEYILSMLDVDTYELVDPEHERAVAVLDEASVELEFYAGDELIGMAWVTDTCEVVVLIEGGGVWYTQTPAVDTVLITAEFGLYQITAEFGREDNE